MSKEMNKLLQPMVKYDLGSGLLISLIIGLIYSFSSATIYFIGISVGLINFACSSYVVFECMYKEKKGIYTFLITTARLILVIAMAVPFIRDTRQISYYLFGFITHYMILMICCIKK